MAPARPTAPLPWLDQQKLLRRATQASLATAALLIGLKAGAWVWTGSVSLLASLVDSVMDALASGAVLLAVHVSLQPADHEHRFGHGKLEPLAGLAQATLLVCSALGLAWTAVQRLQEPEPVDRTAVGIAVIAVSSVVTWLLVRFQARVVVATGSSAVRGDSAHYRTDLLMNAGVIASLAVTWLTGWLWLDPLFGLGVAGLVIWSAWVVGQDSVQLLMDREFDDEDRRRIQAIVLAQPEVDGVHDLRTRRSGLRPFIQFHLELNGAMTLARAHAISDDVEAQVREAFPGAEIIIHADPGPPEPGEDPLSPSPLGSTRPEPRL